MIHLNILIIIIYFLIFNITFVFGEEKLPSRIVSLAPNITEIIYSLGKGEKIIGVTTYCDFPEEAKSKPKVGGFTNPSLEAIIALNPDLVIAVPNGGNKEVVERLISLKIKVKVIKVDLLDDIFNAIKEISQIIGAKEKGEEIVSDIKKKIEEIERMVKDVPKRKVAFIYSKEPLFLAGKGTFTDELIEKSGGINIAGDSFQKYPKYSIEDIIVKGPEVIIEASMGTYDNKKALEFWKKWSIIPAVKENRVYVLINDSAIVPGPRIAEGLAEIASFIHPEVW